ALARHQVAARTGGAPTDPGRQRLVGEAGHGGALGDLAAAGGGLGADGNPVHAPLACNAGHAHAMAMSIYIDTHTHLDFPDFDHDREAVLTDCERLGVRRLLLVGVTVDNWDRIWDLASGDERLYAAVGLHPVFLEQHRPEHLEQLRERLSRHLDHPRCCAVGEFGLDYFIQDADREAQQQLFEAQLALAADFALPVLLHVRRAHAPTIATLKR